MLTYEQFKEYIKTDKDKYYTNDKNYFCFVAGCNNKAEFEIGDARYYCGGCDKHAGIQEKYSEYLK